MNERETAEPPEQPEQYVAPDERVAPVARHQAAPRNDPVRRAAAHVGFERDVEEPDDRGLDERLCDGEPEEAQLAPEALDVARAEEPAREAQREDYEGEPERALAVAPPEPPVPAREPDGRDAHDHEDREDDRVEAVPLGVGLVRVRAGRLAPRPRHLYV